VIYATECAISVVSMSRAIWREFSRVELADGKVKAQCKHCKKVMNRNIKDSMHKHVEECPKKELILYLYAESGKEIGTKANANNLPTQPMGRKKRKLSELGTIMDFMCPELTPSEKKRAHEVLALWCYVCGISFNAVNHELFGIFTNILRPNYKPPHRKTLSGTLLKHHYDKMVQEVEKVTCTVCYVFRILCQ